MFRMSGACKCYVGVYLYGASSVASLAAPTTTTTTIIITTSITTTTTVTITISSQECKLGERTLPSVWDMRGTWQRGSAYGLRVAFLDEYRRRRSVCIGTLLRRQHQWNKLLMAGFWTFRILPTLESPPALPALPAPLSHVGLRAASLIKCPGPLNDGSYIRTILPWEQAWAGECSK